MFETFFKKLSEGSIVLLLVLTPAMFFVKTSLAAIPPDWDVNKLRDEIGQSSAKYDEALFNGSDPNGSFMLRQHAALDAMRSRQFDLEQINAGMGENRIDPYNPDNYTPSNFKPLGAATPSTQPFYVLPDPNNPNPGNTNPFFKGNQGPAQNNQTPTNQPTDNNTGDPNDPYYGGYDENVASQTGETEEPWASKIQHTGLPFGGLITGNVPCSCDSPNYMIFVWDFSSMGLISLLVDEKTRYSKLYEVFTLNVGQYALGTYDPGAVCKINTSSGCISYPTTGVINHGPGVGSSGFMSPTLGTQILRNAPFSF